MVIRLSEFSENVYRVVAKIPRGKVSTYKEVAHAAGSNAYRAVGQVLKKNPHKDVPCHRVVCSDMSIGGFRGDMQNEKIKILKKEGVEIKNNKIAKKHFISF